MSTATHSYCTVFVAGFAVGVHIGVVQEIIQSQSMTPVPLAPSAVVGLINLRGEIVTAIDLRQRLGLPPRPEEQHTVNVVVRIDDQPISLVVDGIGDVVTFQQAPERVPPTLSGVARRLIVGVHRQDDRLLLVLDAPAAVEVSGSGSGPDRQTARARS